MREHIEKHQLHELLKELAQKEYGDKYGEQIFWYFQDVIDDSCKLDVLEEENNRLNNIINELEKWLKENNERLHKALGKKCVTQESYEEVLDKIKELKGEDKE